MDELERYIRSKIRIDENELAEIAGNFKQLDLSKDKHLLRKGQHINLYYFVRRGAVRIYFEKGNKEATAWFAFENDFFTDLESLKSGRPTQYNVQAIEDCELYYIDNTSMDMLYDKYPTFQKFGRLIWESAFINVVNGIIGFQTLTAKERYMAVLANPNLMQRIPLGFLASFLGITQTSLSRLRKEIK